MWQYNAGDLCAAQIQGRCNLPESQFLFHRNLPPQDLSLMTLLSLQHLCQHKSHFNTQCTKARRTFGHNLIKTTEENSKFTATTPSIVCVTSQIGQKMETPVFLDFFEYSSIWRQSQRTKPQLACLVDPGAFFDTPGTPGGGSIQKISRFQHLFLIFVSGGAPYNFFQLIQNKV